VYRREVLSKFYSVNMMKNGLLEYPGADGRIIFKWILKK